MEMNERKGRGRIRKQPVTHTLPSSDCSCTNGKSTKETTFDQNVEPSARTQARSNPEATTECSPPVVGGVSSACTDSDHVVKAFQVFDAESRNLDKNTREFEASLDDFLLELTRCDACEENFPDRKSLDKHQSTAGHCQCVIPNCDLVLSSNEHVTDHLTNNHQDVMVFQMTDTKKADFMSATIDDKQNQTDTCPKTPFQESSSRMIPSQNSPSPMTRTAPRSPRSELAAVTLESSTLQSPVPLLLLQGEQQMINQPAEVPVPVNLFLPKQPRLETTSSSVKIPPVKKRRLMTSIQQHTINALDKGTVPPLKPAQSSGPAVGVPLQVRAPGVGARKRARKPCNLLVEKNPPPAKQRCVPTNHPDGHSDFANASARILTLPRGLTVTTSNVAQSQPVKTYQSVRGTDLQAVEANAVTTLNLNSAVSITSTKANNSRPKTVTDPFLERTRDERSKNGSTCQNATSTARSPHQLSLFNSQVVPTVDLTVADETHEMPVSTNRTASVRTNALQPRGRATPKKQQLSTMCPVCDKVFAVLEDLAPHLMTHVNQRSVSFAFMCTVCNAQYGTQSALSRHMRAYHPAPVRGGGSGGSLRANSGGTSGATSPFRATADSPDWVIPIVDLRQSVSAAQLTALGITHCISLSALRSPTAPIRLIDAPENTRNSV